MSHPSRPVDLHWWEATLETKAHQRFGRKVVNVDVQATSAYDALKRARKQLEDETGKNADCYHVTRLERCKGEQAIVAAMDDVDMFVEVVEATEAAR